jgi:transposase
MPVIDPDAAGIDIAATSEHWVSVPADRPGMTVRPFSPMTHGQEALVAWLKEMRITTVAMESTGVYWVSLYIRLHEAGFRVILINPRGVTRLKPKSDIADCQWLQYLASIGALRPSYVPPPVVLTLRAISRHRSRLIRESARHLQYVQGALDEMNLHLHHVLDDLAGLSGQTIISAIVEGERDPMKLALLCHDNVRTERAIIASALTGQWREEQLFVLQLAHENYLHAQKQIAECDKELWRLSEGLGVRLNEDQLPLQSAPSQRGRRRKGSDKSGKKSKRITSRNAPSGPQSPNQWTRKFHALFGVDLLAVPGVGVLLVLALLTEVGTDWSAFKSAGDFAAWLGLCPYNDQSARKVLRRRTGPGHAELKAMFRTAAQSLSRNQTHLGDHYRRLSARLGAAAANTAMAHKLARIIWHLVTKQKEYDETVIAKLDQNRQIQQARRLRRQAKQLGFELVPLKQAA